MALEEKKTPTIAIIGAGLGGVTLAIGLLNQTSIPPSAIHLYEAASQFSEIGAGIASGPNAVRALRLISPRIAEAYAKCVTNNAEQDLWSTWLGFRWGMPSKDGTRRTEDLILNLEYKPIAGQADEELIPGKPILARSCVHRAAFLDELVKLIPDGMCSFRKTLEDITEQSSSDPVTLHFSDGTTARADIVIGCDGVKSRTRTLLFGAEKAAPQFTNQYAYRSLVPMELAVKAMGPLLAQNGHIHFGYGGYIITYPVDHGKLMNLVAIKPFTEPWPSDKPWTAPATREEMLHDFEGWNEKLLAMLNTVKRPEKWALFDSQDLERFWKGKVCILGDAAHSSTPHLGAGSGMAFEDGYILSNLLGLYFETTRRHGSLDLERVFDAFDSVRRKRAQTLVKFSRDTGKMVQLRDKSVGDDEEGIARLLRNRYDWVWRYDLQESLTKAKAMLVNGK
ncbi:FAD/NAD(P)-binding domain-containing protein [Viridothelium virens]|uniref:FAD/NAD(P)-binding domain-containing protein n=1 Tax=Viridothelium virens TaxID=1048519 RepID=A0A6A6GWK3_VIRVR|nr:FAD/NAD(P)-binding domain-containing protein [Viridothelium virens]